MDNNFSVWWLFIGMGWSLAILALLVIRTFATRPQSARRSDPLSVVKERYARGEIGREQYEEMRAEIGK